MGGRPPSIITIGDGVITGMSPSVTARGAASVPAEVEVIDGGGRLALPGFVNAHAHVDKSWWGSSWVPYGGEATLEGRIAHERAERARYGIPSVASTERVLREFLRHGTTATRTHVDVDRGVGLAGIDAVRDATARLDGAIETTIVAFPQDGVVRRPGVLTLLDEAVANGADVIGGLDPCTIDRDPVAQLDGLFTIAHGFALGELPEARQRALLEAFGELGISWTTVVPVGTAPLPWKAMHEYGVRIGLGTDGIRDLWSPYGDGDLLRVALGFARLHRVRHDEDLTEVVRMATGAAAGFVRRPLHDVEVGAPADLVLLEAENVPDALVRAPRRDLVIAAGRIVVRDGDLIV